MKMVLELGLEVEMVKVGLTMPQLRLTVCEDGAGVEHGDGGGGVDYTIAGDDYW